MTQAIEDPVATLRAAGLRVTRPRLTVLSVIEKHPHAAAETVIQAVRAQIPVSTQAVYDVLGTLTSRGILRRIQPAGSVARYELRVEDNHHHLVCRNCGLIIDIDCAHGVAPCLDADHDSGFVIDEAEVTWWGICPTCQSTNNQPTERNDDA